MAVRPRQKGKKNKLTTMQEFINAVGSILKMEGYTGLKVNNISKQSGRSRALIGRYFTGLAGLQRSYIREKDYWMPFLKRFTLSDVDSIEDIQATFTVLLQENFRSFYSNAEMQKLIIWQISEFNAIISEVSKAREAEGEKLFKASDPAFKNTNVTFRMVVGLLLGGIYYMVLQTKTRNSVVCGIDLDREEDQIDLLKTVGQMVGWACTAANNNDTISQSIPMMNNQFDTLDTIVGQLLTQDEPAATANIILVGEARKLKRSIPNHVLSLNNETQIRTYLKVVVTKLSEIIEDLYRPEHSQHPDADLIVDVLKTVIRHFFDVLPDEVVLPKWFCIHEAAEINLRWQNLKQKLEKVNIDPFLIDAIYFPISRLSSPEVEVRWYDFRYLKVYLSVLDSEAEGFITCQEDLFELMIGLGYNHTRFSAFYTAALKKSLKGLDEASRVIALEKAFTAVAQATSRTDMRFIPGKAGVIEDLQKWIAAEQKRGENLPLSGENTIVDYSLNTTLNTAELSCWQKLQLDAGMYTEGSVDEFTDKVSHNFKNKRGMRPSSASVRSKLYGKEREIYQTLQACVSKIKEDIDRFLR
ncbi:hypothetical protein [Pedobacter sp. GR22-6]|uniref:hypothetical protein n=1 Tax=Pedobacter sp. GR22-6 TaxID=3127957 RepID=UPI00307EDEED